jgi:hypothetical protein
LIIIEAKFSYQSSPTQILSHLTHTESSYYAGHSTETVGVVPV